MNYLSHNILFIFIILILIKDGLSEILTSYLKKIEEVNVEEESSQCLSVYYLFRDCVANKNQESLLDFNEICDTFNNGTCQTIQKDMDKTLSKCSPTVQKELSYILNENYLILSFYCYKDSENEYCPMSKLFQKYITLNEEITVEQFENANFLNDLCKTKSCYDYIDSSYKAMKTLYDIGIINNEMILETESNIKSYLKSENCQDYLTSNKDYQQFKPSLLLIIISIMLYVLIF